MRPAHVEARVAQAGVVDPRPEGSQAKGGALVQEMAPDGPDLTVGGIQDPVFGPVVLDARGRRAP